MTLALEINDVGLILAVDGELVVEEPGYAMLDGPEPETGAAAARRARLKPIFVETRHWQDLATTALARPMPAAATYAEVAHAQLASLVRPHAARDAEALLAVPAWYTREQLALLLGVAQEAGLRPVGLVDAALASAALEPAPESLLQLELELHRGVLTVLDHGGELRRTRFELLPQHGWLALQQAWLDRVAAAFVRKTRFDPLHEAASEQRLWDSLPQWLAALERDSTVEITMEAAGVRHAVELSREDFAAAASGIYGGLVQALQRARAMAGPLHLRLSHRLAGLPGLDERLAELRDCETIRLPRGAAALGALAYERTLRRDAGSLTLVQRLPVPPRSGATRAAAPAVVVPAGDRPTHVVYGSRAWRIAGEPLAVGSAVPGGRRALTIEAGPGISRMHCTLARGEDGVWLEDLSTYGTLLNGERVRGRVAVRTGDRLRIGNPGIECELVCVVDGDGAA